MDIIVNNEAENAGKYSIVLAARRDESWNKPGLVLTRQIKVNITQEGIRNNFDVASDDNPYGGTSYIGAFYRNTETGERIIQNRFGAGWWEASVPNETISGSGNQRNWIILSSTPSLDPQVGTSNPGKAENYPVIPNKYKGEDGYKVTGKNRLYFRIGLRSQNTATSPRYGYVKLRYIHGQLDSSQPVPVENDTEVKILGGGTEQIKIVKIYVRQGEVPDVLLTTTSPVTGGPSTRPAESIVKFSPYNVTVQHMLDNINSTNNFVVADNRDATHRPVHVKYPTQAGAIFLWGAPPASTYYKYAYYPRSLVDNEFENIDPISSVWPDRFFSYTSNPYWVAPSGSSEPSYKDLIEVCPDGYRRPNNGAVSALARNNTLAEVVKSEFMGSLFSEIPIGDGHAYIPGDWPSDPNNPDGIVRYTPKSISNVRSGLYADVFFDRYPIQSNQRSDAGIAVGVCLNDTRAAYTGTLCFNPVTYASVFFPNAGRRDSQKGTLQWRGSSGYYSTASLGNQWIPENEKDKFLTFWDMELTYRPAPVSAVLTFGTSMRCVKVE